MSIDTAFGIFSGPSMGAAPVLLFFFAFLFIVAALKFGWVWAFSIVGGVLLGLYLPPVAGAYETVVFVTVFFGLMYAIRRRQQAAKARRDAAYAAAQNAAAAETVAKSHR